MATIKDVARIAGVSVGTVSNVLNGRESVKPGNRKRVYEAMKQSGFRYNMTASALRTRSTKNIGLIIPSITNPYYPELARGVEDAARLVGLTVFLCNDDRDMDKEREYVQALLSKGVDGIILLKPRLSCQELRDIRERTALVLGDAGDHIRLQFNVVNADDVQGVVSAMNFLGRNGHRQIGMITGLMESYSSQCRLEAYKRYLESRRIPFRKEYVVSGNYSWKSGCTAAKQLMGLPDPPTAVFAANDIMAIGAMKGVQTMGYRIPEDVSIIGYDDIEMSNLSKPALTTIHQPKYEMGQECLHLLYSIINGEEENPRQITMENRLIVRDSVGMAR